MKKILIILGLVFSFFAAALSGFAAEAKTEVYGENGKFGLKCGNETITKAEYKKLIRLGEKAWIFQKGSRFGLIDDNGNILVKPKYRHADRVLGQFAKLGNDNDYGLYDETGKAILEPEYSSIDLLFGKMFLICKNYKYGVTDFEGKILLKPEFDDIYMPKPTAMRIKYNGEWYEIERMKPGEIELPEETKKVIIDNKEFKVTHLAANAGVLSGYTAVTAADYALKIFPSISPAYEQTIDELMFSQGAETVSILIKLGWLPKFPFTYAKKYYQNLKAPNNGPLSGIKDDLRRKID